MAFGRRKNNPGPTADETPVDTPEPTTEAANAPMTASGPTARSTSRTSDSAEDAATARLDPVRFADPDASRRPGSGELNEVGAQRDLGGDPERPVHHRRLRGAEVARPVA